VDLTAELQQMERQAQELGRQMVPDVYGGCPYAEAAGELAAKLMMQPVESRPMKQDLCSAMA
jgi:hypothetical protein